MADYLTDLAASLSESVGFLRPRQPSLFEPASGEERIPAPSQPLEQVEETYSPSRRRESLGEPSPRPAMPAVNRTPSAFVDPPREPDAAAPTFQETVLRPAKKTAAEIPSSVEWQTSQESVQAAGGPEPTFPTPDTQLPHRPAEPHPEIKPRSATKPAHSVPTVDNSQPFEPRSLAPTGQPPINLAADATNVFQPPPVSPSLTRAREQPSQSEHRAERPPEPTIHITIGRVEVRATSEAESRARRKEEASPVMTLDEYLRKRGSR